MPFLPPNQQRQSTEGTHTETNEQKFSLRGVQCEKLCSYLGGNLIYARDELSRMKGKEELSVTCVEVMI